MHCVSNNADTNITRFQQLTDNLLDRWSLLLNILCELKIY